MAATCACEHVLLVTWSHGFVIMNLLERIMSPDRRDDIPCDGLAVAERAPVRLGEDTKGSSERRIRLLQPNPRPTHAAKMKI